jgi:hypothetical protein
MKNLIGFIVAVALTSLLVLERAHLNDARNEAANLRAELAASKAELQRASDTPKADPKESERQSQERAELAKLRGEVSALRKEKVDWLKNRSVAEAAALQASQTKPSPDTTTPAAQGMQWVEQILNGPSAVKGTEIGNIRRKALNGEGLTEAEQALLLNMNGKAAEIEKSPDEFSAFQSAYIGSLLGWNNDPRADHIKGILTAAVNAANTGGYDYNMPSQNADKWTDEQKALNARATSAIQNILKPDERAVFDKALSGVLGVDTSIANIQGK